MREVALHFLFQRLFDNNVNGADHQVCAVFNLVSATGLEPAHRLGY